MFVKSKQGVLAKLESFMQYLIETPFSRLFPSKLEPIELAKKLERAMDDNILQSIGKKFAPTYYDVALCTKDYRRLTSSSNVLIRELQEYLIQVAKKRHYTLRVVPVITFHENDRLSAGSVKIATSLVDEQSGGTSPHTFSMQPTQMGQPLPMPSPLDMPLDAIPPARLIIENSTGQKQIFEVNKLVIAIGRQVDNDIIIEDKRVSRYHAQIKYMGNSRFDLYDLGSTNGLTVNSQLGIRQHTLVPNDTFIIGGYTFQFEL